MRAVEIDLVPIRALTLALVDARVHLVERHIGIETIGPPPIGQRVGLDSLVIDDLAVRGERLVQPRLEPLIVADLTKPLLVRGLVNGHGGEVIDQRAVVVVVDALAVKVERGEFHSIIEVTLLRG